MPNVAGLFFPQSKSLGIDLGTYSPALLEKIVYAGAKESFQEASRSLQHLADVRVPKKQVERITKRIGGERLAERAASLAAYQALPLVEKDRSGREQVPQVVALSMDGGRYQRNDACAATDDCSPSAAKSSDRAAVQRVVPSAESAEPGGAEPSRPAAAARPGHWREFKAGCLLTLSSTVSEHDPCPEIPATFLQPDRVARLSREVHAAQAAEPAGAFPDAAERRCEADYDVGASGSEPDDAAAELKQPPQRRAGAPTVLVRSVLASAVSNVAFGVMLAAAAWHRGFAAAPRRAFLGDGAAGNWTVWKKLFPRYTPILDFIHLLSYVYAAAMAGQSYANGWSSYAAWIGELWKGRVEAVLAALRERVAALGPAPRDAATTDPRRVVAETLRYISNNRSRMRYDNYRRLGLPLTTCHMESTVKQINQRVKGTEKFWSEGGGEALLQLRADYLSDTDPLETFWQRRQDKATGQRSYSCAA